MSIVTSRVLYSKNSAITDVSEELLNYQSGSAAYGSYTSATDYIYCGSLAPFNHFYLKLSASSAVTSNVMSMEYWDGRQWVAPYRIDDKTNGLTQSGFVTFFPDRDKGWLAESTNDKGDQITGLTTIKIYDMYWVRFKLSLDVPLGFTLSWVGRIFSNDNDLASEFPDLVRSAMLLTFGASKTSWEEQHVKATEILIQDLITNQVIEWGNQILIKEEFTLAAVYKCAQIIFNALGDDYRDQKLDAEAEYRKRLDKSIYRVDKNSDALLNKQELTNRTGFMSR